jgi:hypothetical protein
MFNEEKLIARQNKLLSERPLFDIELTSRCNKRCPMCPRDAFERKNQDMDASTFDTLMQWLPQNCDIMFAGYGEPLLNKHFFDYLRIIHNSGKVNSVSVYTNAILLNKKLMQDLFAKGLDLLQVSITSIEELATAENIFSLSKDLNPVGKIRFNVLYRNQTDFDKIWEKIVQTFPNHSSNFFMKKIHNRGGSLFPFSYNSELNSCGTFFKVTFIDANGNIQICSNDINGKNTLGNIQDITFKQLIALKQKYLGNSEIAKICSKCSDEYRQKHFDEV